MVTLTTYSRCSCIPQLMQYFVVPKPRRCPPGRELSRKPPHVLGGPKGPGRVSVFPELRPQVSVLTAQESIEAVFPKALATHQPISQLIFPGRPAGLHRRA